MCKIKELAHVIMEDGKFKVCSVGQQVKSEGHWQNSPLLRRLAFSGMQAFSRRGEAPTVGSTICVTQRSRI